MSHMKNKINITRKKLDKLDNRLLDLIKKRTFLVNNILKNKKYKNQIIDKKRIKIILKTIKSNSLKKKIDPKITNRIWKSMIGAFIDYEYRNFKKK
ncbi:MAG: chorismate mutase [Pelagibacteraceae bacterium TMED287]|nr:MAG: chorismate mutase [Pelagibacteraceae bacterium TMED287]